jgi:hypothetical protein
MVWLILSEYLKASSLTPSGYLQQMASGILVECFNFPVFEFLEAESGVGFQRLLCNGRTP